MSTNVKIGDRIIDNWTRTEVEIKEITKDGVEVDIVFVLNEECGTVGESTFLHKDNLYKNWLTMSGDRVTL